MWTIASTLAQDVVWITQDGRRMLISDMKQSHRENTRAYLLRRAEEIHEHVRWLRVRETLRGLRIDDPHQLVGETFAITIEMNPENWILATPFMIALEKAIRDHDAVDGDVVNVRYEEWVDGVPETRLIG